jgi:hypothetical protein
VNDYGLIVNPETLANLPAGAEELVGRARHRVAQILGPPPPGGRIPAQRGSVGTCHVCGQVAPLTFEHMPPRAAGNSRPRRAVVLETSLAQPVGEFPSRGWTSMQRGVGVYGTCERCNTFSGADYVPAYLNFVSAVVNGVADWAERAERAGESLTPEKLRMSISPLHTGAIVRQVLFMLLTGSGSDGLGERYPVLREIVLHKSTLPLPSEMALRLTLLATDRSRVHPVVAELNLATGQERALVEVAFTPFGWLLEIGDPSDRPAVDVSRWTQVPPDEEQRIELLATVGSVVTAIPADYRHRWEIPDHEVAEADQEAAPPP